MRSIPSGWTTTFSLSLWTTIRVACTSSVGPLGHYIVGMVFNRNVMSVRLSVWDWRHFIHLLMCHCCILKLMIFLGSSLVVPCGVEIRSPENYEIQLTINWIRDRCSVADKGLAGRMACLEVDDKWWWIVGWTEMRCTCDECGWIENSVAAELLTSLGLLKGHSSPSSSAARWSKGINVVELLLIDISFIFGPHVTHKVITRKG